MGCQIGWDKAGKVVKGIDIMTAVTYYGTEYVCTGISVSSSVWSHN